MAGAASEESSRGAEVPAADTATMDAVDTVVEVVEDAAGTKGPAAALRLFRVVYTTILGSVY